MMGCRSGNIRGGSNGRTQGVINASGKQIHITPAQLSQAKPISSLGDKRVVRDLQRAISKYETVFGLRQTNIVVAPLKGAYGVTYISTDGSKGIILDSTFFGRKKEQIVKLYKDNYAIGDDGTRFKNVTSTPLTHTITHELGHATWTNKYSSANARAASIPIRTVYKEWLKDKERTKNGYGTYGTTSINEFFAEMVAKSLRPERGQQDKYTRKIRQIIKHYNL